MHKQGLFRWVLVAVFALTSIGISGMALAQDDETDDDLLLIEIEGEVEVLEDDMIVVSGTIVAPAGAFIPATLEVGDYVVIEGYLLDDDTIMAISLEVVDPDEMDPPDDEDDMEDPEDDETDDDMDEDDLDDDLCMRDDHPVVLAMVETYGESLGVTYEELITLHCDGEGLGNIIKVLEAAERSGFADLIEGEEGEEGELVAGLTFEEMWELYEEAGNLGQFKKVLADEYGIHPSDLAPGLAVGKAKPDKTGDDDDDDDDSGPPAFAGPPGGDGPPGLSRDDGPGKSSSAPGQQKDKAKGRGR